MFLPSSPVYLSTVSTSPLLFDNFSDLPSTLETSYNRQMIWARFRQIAKHFCHPCRHPSVSSSPKIGYIRCMIEKSIRTLQLIQIHRHFFSSALNVFQFTGHFISMRLNNGIIYMSSIHKRVCQLYPFAAHDFALALAFSGTSHWVSA